MATLLDLPMPGFDTPHAGESWEAHYARTGQMLDALFAVSDGLPENEVEGGVLRFPVADGYAFYRVVTAAPLTLEHIPFGDAYQVSSALIRGLRLTDVQNMLSSEKRLRMLFNTPSAA